MFSFTDVFGLVKTQKAVHIADIHLFEIYHHILYSFSKYLFTGKTIYNLMSRRIRIQDVRPSTYLWTLHNNPVEDRSTFAQPSVSGFDFIPPPLQTG